MGMKDKLYEESRIIRKEVESGKTTKEIMDKLSLSANQIKYRINTRYKGIAKSILKKLAINDGKETENIQIANSTKKTLVLDTSALGRKGSFEFIMKQSKVILLLDVVKELEKRKKAEGILGQNIRHLLAESAKDYDGKKFKVVLAEKVSDYVDENILHFCRGKNVVIYTADNAMAIMAKGYGIQYILAEDTVPKKKAKATKKVAEPVREEKYLPTVEEIVEEKTIISENEKVEPEEEAITVDVEALVQKMQENSISEEHFPKAKIANVDKLGKALILTIPQTTKIAYVVLEGDKVKRPVAGNLVNLKEGNIVLVLTYKHHGLCIARYEITDMEAEEHAIYLWSDKLNDDETIDKLDLPKEAKREVHNYYALVRKN